MDARLWLPALLLILCAGCADLPPPEVALEQPVELGREYRESDTGTITGRVTWSGTRPSAPPFTIFGVAAMGQEERKERANPHLPKIDDKTGGVASCIVFLRKVDLDKSRPWTYPKVRVEQVNNLISINQGETSTTTGFVRRGDTIEVVNRDAHLHILRADGADFFSLPFPERDKPSTRRLHKAGLVELRSGAGYFWMSGHLFVDDHPYYTRTDSQGLFTLEKVPTGTYELVFWLPHWEVTKKERDPELALVHRLSFKPAVERHVTVVVEAGQTADRPFRWSLGDFD